MKYIDIKIKENLKRKNIPIKKMIEDLGLTEQGYIYSIKNETLRVKTLIDIASYLKISVSYLVNENDYQVNENTLSVNDKSENYNSKLHELQNENELLKATIKDKEEIIILLKAKSR